MASKKQLRPLRRDNADRLSADRFSASVPTRTKRSAWIGSLLTLVCFGFGYLQWQLSSPSLEAGGPAGETDSVGQILSAQGGVEYRRGDLGPWRKAQSGIRLTWGDWIKSADDGTAKIRFSTGSIYVLPPDTLGRLDWLSDNPPSRRSAQTEQGRATGGQTEHTVADIGLQWIEVDNGMTPNSSPLPVGPQLVSPARDFEIDLASKKQLRLTWQSVSAARRYALNVSSSPSFAANIIEDDDRRKPSARIGIRGEGVFYWRVAAVDREGSQGAWSEIRSFRVTDPGNRTNRG